MDSANLKTLQEISERPESWCSVAIFNTGGTLGNGKWDWYRSRGCHGFMAVVSGNKNTDIVTTLYHGQSGYERGAVGAKNRVEYDECVPYWLWLASKDCPWRALRRELVIGKDDKIIGMKLIDGANDQPHLLMNFLVATRVAFEHPPMVRAFNKFMAAGLSEVESYFAMYHFNETSDGSTVGHPRQSHFALDTYYSDPSFARLSKADPVLPNKNSWNYDHVYTPNNTIWCKDGKTKLYQASPGDVPRCRPFVQESMYKGSFPERFKKLQSQSLIFTVPAFLPFKELVPAIVKHRKEFFSG